MKITFKLTQDDLIKFNEYHTEHSPIFIKDSRKNRILVPIIYLFIAILFLLSDKCEIAIIFAVLAVLWFTFFPIMLKRRNKKFFQKHVEENSKDIAKEPSTVEIKEDSIYTSSYIGNSSFKFSVVEKIVENDGFTYIYIGKGMAIIIPHDRVSQSQRNDLIAEVKKQKEIANNVSESIHDTKET